MRLQQLFKSKKKYSYLNKDIETSEGIESITKTINNVYTIDSVAIEICNGYLERSGLDRVINPRSNDGNPFEKFVFVKYLFKIGFHLIIRI